LSNFTERLHTFLTANGQPAELELLTADASTREYFRITWNGENAVACVYPEPFGASEATYLDTTELFLAGGLPVAKVYAADTAAGIIVQEDLGNRILRDALDEADETRYTALLNEAISMIAMIQKDTPRAYERKAIASTLRFDTEKLLWELNYFKEHYFTTYAKRPLSEKDSAVFDRELREVAEELDAKASVLCHRDFHSANLMIDARGKMRIIDHQDARIGSPAYDLVSLLLDRITEPPSREWLAEKRRYFLDLRVTFGMPRLDEEEFANEFRLQAIQRCLKAVGTFSYQSTMRGKTYFIPYIIPTFRIVSRVAESLGRFPVIREILHREIAATRDEGPDATSGSPA
jgi:aminoglycoside/choline kinase family phosphotransferase